MAGIAAPRGIIANLVTNIWVMSESAQKQQGCGGFFGLADSLLACLPSKESLTFKEGEL